jgi:ribosomal subunit interface protein
MQLTVQGKQLDVGNALRTHVETKLEDLNEKFFNHATFANVTFAREGHGHGLIRAHIQIRIGKDINVLADATEGDAYIAFDNAALKVTRQMGKYKERLRDHHQHTKRTPEQAEASSRAYAASGGRTKEDENGVPRGKDPVIVAELTTAIRPMSVSDAVMRMDLSNAPVMLFRNPKSGAVNMVYRRKDGNIGWVDPETEKKHQQAKAPAKQQAAKPAAKKASAPAKKSAAKKAPAKKAKSNVKKLKPVAKKAKAAPKAAKRLVKAAPKKAAKRARR